MPELPPSRHQFLFYLIAVVLGACAGLAEIKVADLLLTALLVLTFTMALGLACPERPWRWTVLVAACVPLWVLVAHALLRQPSYRAQIYESFLAFLPGAVGAYAGAFMRRLVGSLLT